MSKVERFHISLAPSLMVVAGLVAGTTAVLSSQVAADPGDAPVTGQVFRDVNGNGERDAADPGESDVTVTAYDASGGVAVGVVASDGSYSIDVEALAGPDYRVEFTGLPSFLQPGPSGTGNGTDIQFVTAGGTADFGVWNPADFCQANPDLACTSHFHETDDATLFEVPYDAGTLPGDANPNLGLASSSLGDGTDSYVTRHDNSQTGPVRGLAYHRESDVLFSAAYAKRLTRYPGATEAAPNDAGPDIIYVTPRDGSAPTAFFNQEAGSDNHDYSGGFVGDDAFWDSVGKTAWGDIDLSEDETVLYAANQFDRLIYAIPVDDSGAVPTAGAATTIDLEALTDVEVDCDSGDWVPGAVGAHDGLVYLGATCTAETIGAATDYTDSTAAATAQAALVARVYAYDPDTGTADEVATIPLDYARGNTSDGTHTGPPQGIAPGAFFPWQGSEQPDPVRPPNSPFAPFGQSYYPQPWLTDIEFDDADNMILGVSDRFADQSGNEDVGVGTQEGVSAGDQIRLSPSGATWTSPADEFFDSEEFGNPAKPTHFETSLGSLVVVPGSGEVISTAFDPSALVGSDDVLRLDGSVLFNFSFRSGGFIRQSAADGSRVGQYQFYGVNQPGTFGKGTGLGDLEALCDRAPIELGDYVWIDADGDGVQDPGEDPADGVTVNLYADGGVLIATTTTDASGRYYFTDADVAAGPTSATSIETQTAYTIRFDEPTDFDVGGPLDGLSLTSIDGGGADAGADQRDSDAAPDVDGFGEIAVTTGLAGANDHTFDVGFTAVEPTFRVGNLVWNDIDDDGSADSGEPGIPGVLVQLLDGDTVVAETVTDSDGKYEFADLEAGDYSIRIPNAQTTTDPALSPSIDAGALVGARSSGFGATGTTGLDPDGATGTDDDDNDQDGNGNLLGGQDLTSGVFTLGDDAVEPTDETLRSNDGTDDDPGSQATLVSDDRSNLTVDFGIFRGVRIGNQVWLDDGNGNAANADNGVFDTGESGIPGVTVELWSDVDGDGVFEPTGDDSTGLLQVDITDAEGNYHFGGVTPGDDLFVAVNDLPATLINARSSAPFAADPISADNVDDGDPTAGYLSVTRQFTAPEPGTAAGNESDTNPTGDDSEADANLATGTFRDNDSDLRIDLGFVADVLLELGNQIWFDDDLDGIYDRGVEPAVPDGVVVNLWTDPEGNGIPNTLVATDVTTGGDGQYLFTGLEPGTYIVQLDPSNFESDGPLEGSTPTTGPGSSADPDDNRDDNNDGFTRTGVPGVITGPVTIDNATEPLNEFDNPSAGTPNDFSNLSVDIGLVGPLELGNRIFIDSDEDGDGDGEEPVPAGVVVNLLDGDGDFVATTTTDADGNYLFTGLDDGDYIVELPASNFADGGPLEGFDPSTGAASSTDPEDDVDDNNDGVGQTDGSIRTGVVTLSRGDEPTNEIDDPTSTSDGSSNLTVDIGVVAPLGSIGNRVWVDFDRDGVQDAGELNLPNIVVQLLDEDGDVIATTTTDANGIYLFDELPAGEYRVRVVPSSLPDANTFAPQNSGTSDASDSDADTASGTSDVIVLGRGEDIDDVDFGVIQTIGELPSTGGDSFGALRIGMAILLTGLALVTIAWAAARRRGTLRTTTT